MLRWVRIGGIQRKLLVSGVVVVSELGDLLFYRLLIPILPQGDVSLRRACIDFVYGCTLVFDKNCLVVVGCNYQGVF